MRLRSTQYVVTYEENVETLLQEDIIKCGRILISKINIKRT
jgi:hypothetical protein